MESTSLLSLVSHRVRGGTSGNFYKASCLAFLNRLRGGVIILEEAGQEQVFGSHTPGLESIEARIQVSNPEFYRMVCRQGSIGAAEAYMHGYWRSPSLVTVIRLFSRNIDVLNKLDGLGQFANKIFDWVYLKVSDNSLAGSKRNIAAHYDLSNAFFSEFLSKDMMYSAAIYDSPEMPLEEASENKLRTICEKLKLKASDHLLEIGSGWGGMAIFAAEYYGARVTTTTISEQQYNYVVDLVARKNLRHKITVLKQDYRLLEGKYDKLVSIEMIEAVGANHYKQYFSKCDQLLKDNGLMLLQAITIPNQRFLSAKRSVDFIKRYIFPGGCLPSNEVIESSLRRYTKMQCIGLHDITEDYALTLKAWRKAFHLNRGAIVEKGFDDAFMKMWDFYLCYCEGGFKERVIGTTQLLLAKEKFRFT